MKTRLPLAVLLVSFLLPSLHLRAASDVSVSSAATSGGSFSGGNPNVFTPTAAAAVANQTTIQTSLNAGASVRLNTASVSTGSGDLQIAATVSKTVGPTATLTLNAARDLAINFGLSANTGTMPLALTAGRAITSAAPITSNGGNITLNTVQPFSLGNSLDAGAGQILLQTGSLASSTYQTIAASTVSVFAPAALRLYGNVAGNLSVAGTLAPGDSTQSLSVSGTLALQSTATTTVKLGNSYGSISATGPVTLGGALDVAFANGLENQITNGYSFTILSGTSITGTFTGLPNNARITFPDELGSVKITYTATAVTLSDWQPYICELTWDPGTADAGTQVLTNTSTRAGRHYFHINTQATDIGAWKTRFTVTNGEAHLYLNYNIVPQTIGSYYFKSERTGSDGLVLRSDQYSARQDWYLLVDATAGAQWSIFTGRAWAQDLGTLSWTDTNSNSQYDIGERANCRT